MPLHLEWMFHAQPDFIHSTTQITGGLTLPCKCHLCRICFVPSLPAFGRWGRNYDNYDLLFRNRPTDLCAARHWQACSRPGTLWTGAGGTLPDIPPQWSECWEPWPGDWGPGSYSGRLPASTAPQSPEPAPTTTERKRECVYEAQKWQAEWDTIWEKVFQFAFRYNKSFNPWIISAFSGSF